jgi:phosphatidylinositol-specific phospholipase C-like protein
MRQGCGRWIRLGIVVAALCAVAVPASASAEPWTQRALGLQYELASDVPLRNAPWVGTHNSFNSTAEMGPALSPLDSNQKLPIVDQLRLGIRSVELDVHWFPSARTGGFAPVVCHATGEHGGCSVEKTLAEVLSEIHGWLRENPDQVLLLYLEDHLDAQEGHDAAAAVLEQELGWAIHRPPAGGGCAATPLDLRRNEVRSTGAQVVIVSSCGEGTAWPAQVWDFSDHVETRPRGYRDFPDCGPDFDRATYDNEMVRYFEDSTRVTAGGSVVGASSRDDGITPATAAAMARCGVDLFGLDQLTAADPRLESLVWSWAPGEPGGGDCAVQRADARWETRACRGRRQAACRAADGSWLLTLRAEPPSDAARACAAQSAVLAVPRTGYEGQLLRVAMEAVGAREAWLGIARAGDSWRAFDSR